MGVRRHVPRELTEPERETQRAQGGRIGPTVEERPVRGMSLPELRELLFRLKHEAQTSRRQVWLERQAAKVQAELSRRRAAG